MLLMHYTCTVALLYQSLLPTVWENMATFLGFERACGVYTIQQELYRGLTSINGGFGCWTGKVITATMRLHPYTA